jgi:hypothetical protein
MCGNSDIILSPEGTEVQKETNPDGERFLYHDTCNYLLEGPPIGSAKGDKIILKLNELERANFYVWVG